MKWNDPDKKLPNDRKRCCVIFVTPSGLQTVGEAAYCDRRRRWFFLDAKNSRCEPLFWRPIDDVFSEASR